MTYYRHNIPFVKSVEGEKFVEKVQVEKLTPEQKELWDKGELEVPPLIVFNETPYVPPFTPKSQLRK
jgi:hypothetical protein